MVYRNEAPMFVWGSSSPVGVAHLCLDKKLPTFSVSYDSELIVTPPSLRTQRIRNVISTGGDAKDQRR